jgi:hypothetical protein
MGIRVIYDGFARDTPCHLLFKAIGWHLLGKLSLHTHVELPCSFHENAYAGRGVLLILGAICSQIELMRLQSNSLARWPTGILGRLRVCSARPDYTILNDRQQKPAGQASRNIFIYTRSHHVGPG